MVEETAQHRRKSCLSESGLVIVAVYTQHIQFRLTCLKAVLGQPRRRRATLGSSIVDLFEV